MTSQESLSKVQEQYNKQNECASTRTTNVRLEKVRGLVEGKRYNGGEEACEGRSRERECVRVQHTDRRLEAHSRRAIVNPSHAHTTHMPCTCHAHAMHMHMRVGWSSCCASSTSSTPSRTARCARAWYRCACYVVSLSSPPISTHLNPTLPRPQSTSTPPSLTLTPPRRSTSPSSQRTCAT